MRSAAAALLLFLAALPATATSIIAPWSSSPGSFLQVGTNVFFSANDAVHGWELWVTDGTPAGTRLVADLLPGAESSSPRLSAAIGNIAIFVTAVPGTSATNVWRSDGTAAGTWRLLDLPRFSLVYGSGDRVFIRAFRSDLRGEDLWVSDGSAAAQQIATVSIAPDTYPFSANGRLYFTASDSIAGAQLWTSDGTAAGTHTVQTAVECPGPSCAPPAQTFFRLGAGVYYLAPSGLWKTDGTTAGTVRVADTPRSGRQYLPPSATMAYFLPDGTLWRTDGTAAGTRRVTELPAGAWTDVAVLDNGRVYLIRSLSEFIPAFGYELWTTDGTNPPVLINESALAAFLTTSGNRLWMRAGPETGTELQIVDEGSAPRNIEIDPRRTIPAAASTPVGEVVLGGRLLFAASTVSGRELWISDGTDAGTTMLANIGPDPPSGTIAGFVRDATSHAGIGDATLTLCIRTQCDDEVTTAPDGRYSFDGVIPGDGYTMKVTAPSYVAQSTAVVVTAGNTTAQDVALQKGSIVSGSIRRASTGALLRAGNVAILDAAGSVADLVMSMDGTFATRPLPAGTYYAEARGFPLAVDQRFRGVNCPAGCNAGDGEAIAVTSATNIAGIDFLLHDYGTIAGTVRDASTGQPAAGVHLEFQVHSIATGAAVTGIDGRYVSSLLAPGSYTVVALARDGMQYTEYATPVAVTVDGAVTGIDLVVQPRADRARLAGVIRDSAGDPVERVWVTLLSFDGRGVSDLSATTAADGTFAIYDLTPATYYLRAEDELYGGVDCFALPCSIAGAIPLTFTAGRTTAVEMKLRSRSAVVSGKVVDGRTGQPLTDYVYLVSASGGNEALRYTMTDGTFTISGLSRTPMYLFAAAFAGADGAFYPGVRTACRGSSCSVPAGAQPVSGTMSGIVLSTTQLGSMSGIVYDTETGQALPFVEVRIQKADGTAAGTVRSDSMAGRYTWTGADGSYYVSINGQLPLFETYGQVYRDRNCIPAPCVPASGDAVVLTPGTATTGIDFHLKRVLPTGTATGRVVDALTGQPMAGVDVETTPYFAGTSAYTDASGSYTARVPAGSYTMSARGPNPYLTARSGTFTVAAGTMTSVPEIRMQRLRITSVSPTSGSPLGGTPITVKGDQFSSTSTLQVGGTDARIVSITPTEITAFTPRGNAGPAHVTVREVSLNRSLSFLHAFLFDPAAPPPGEPATVDLSVSMSASHATFRPGDSVDYTIVVRNAGPWLANNVAITGPVPPGTTYIGWDSTTTLYCYDPAVLCKAATLASGATIELRTTMKVSATESVVNRFTVSADEPDTNPANNTASLTITPQAPPPPPPPAPVPIPALGTTALLALAAVLAALAWLRMRG